MKEPETSPLIRAALFVRDLDRATAFYRDVFGFDTVYYEGVLDHPATAQIIGSVSDARVECRIIRGDGPNFGMVGLFHVSPQPPDLERSHAGVNLGEAVLVFIAATSRRRWGGRWNTAQRPYAIR